MWKMGQPKFPASILLLSALDRAVVQNLDAVIIGIPCTAGVQVGSLDCAGMAVK